MNREIYSRGAPESAAPGSQAIEAGGLVFVSLQLPVDPATGKIISGDVALRTHQAMANVQVVLQAAGCRMKDVVRLTTYVTGMGGIEDIRAVFRAYFGDWLPAMTLIQLDALPQGAQIAIEAVAVLP